jgi:DNA-binding transcriptional LysR family regulator
MHARHYRELHSIHGVHSTSRLPQGFDLNLLVVFDALFSERHVSRAGRRMGLSQPAMSHALARLRRIIGDELFVRSGNAMVPTNRARQLAGGVSAALEQIGRALGAEAPFRPAELAMQVRMMATEYGEIRALGAFVAALRAEAPGIILVIQRAQKLFDLPRAELDAGKIDYALGFYDAPPPGARLFSSLLLTDKWVCIARRGAYKRLSLSAFLDAGHVRVVYGAEGAGLGSIVDPEGGLVGEALRRASRQRSVALIVPHLLTVPFIVRQAGVIGVVPHRVAIAAQRSLRLDIHKLPVRVADAQLRLVWHERVDRDFAHRWLRETLAASCRGTGGRGAGPAAAFSSMNRAR